MASFKHLIGSSANRAMQRLLRDKHFPLARSVPHGLSVYYDIQRMSGSRDIGPLFDVGANVGQTAYQMTRYFPHAQIFCFEPVAESFAKLEARYGKSAVCLPMALGAEAGELEIQTFSDSELASFCKVRDSATSTGTQKVRIETLDRFCTERGIARIGLLKLDVQGWEMNVLTGARGLIARKAIGFVLAEVGFSSGETDMQPFGELNSFMDASGLVFCGLYDSFRWGPAKGYVGFSNALYALRG